MRDTKKVAIVAAITVDFMLDMVSEIKVEIT
jgi:hypothetical protein